MLPAIIGAVGGLVGTGIAGIFGNNNAKRNIAMNERLTKQQMDFADRQATIAYERQQALMDKNNAYNDPTAQMARLKQAGLNPYLAYDNGNATIQASSASVQQAATPSAVAVPDYYANGTNMLANGINSVFQNFAQLVRLKNETKLANAQAANLTASTGNTNVQTELAKSTMRFQIDAARLQNDLTAAGIDNAKVQKFLISAQTELAKAQTDKAKADKFLTIQQTAYQEALNKFVPDRQAAELAKIIADIKLAAAQEDSVRMATSLQQFVAMSGRITAMAAMTNSKKEGFENLATKIANGLISSMLGDSDQKTIGNAVGNILGGPSKALFDLGKFLMKKLK